MKLLHFPADLPIVTRYIVMDSQNGETRHKTVRAAMKRCDETKARAMLFAEHYNGSRSGPFYIREKI
jgi:hypothetical protein